MVPRGHPLRPIRVAVLGFSVLGRGLDLVAILPQHNLDSIRSRGLRQNLRRMGHPAGQPLSSPRRCPAPISARTAPDVRYPRAQSGTPWRQLPTEYEKWSSVYRRYARWRDQGVWPRRMAYLQADPELSAVRLSGRHSGPERYPARNAVERGLDWLKRGCRHDKYARRFLGFLYLAGAWIGL